MQDSVLTLQETQWVWIIYYLAATSLWLLTAWLLNYQRFLWSSISFLALLAGLFYTPWFISDQASDMAPAFIILLFNLLGDGQQSPLKLMMPIFLIFFLTFLLLSCLLGFMRRGRR